MTNIIKVGNLHDGSMATTHEELVRYWREEADRFWNNPVPTNEQTISTFLRGCANDLERINLLTASR